MPLTSIWVPRRDARGLLVPKASIAAHPYAGGTGPSTGFERALYFYPVQGGGIYRQNTNSISRSGEYGGDAKAVPHQSGLLGIDVPNNWEWKISNGTAPTIAPGSGTTMVFVSVFSLYNAAKTINNATVGYPSLFGESRSTLPNDSNFYGFWGNASGQQAVTLYPGFGFGGTSITVSGLQNGLHCIVAVVDLYATATAGAFRVFLDGSFYGSGTGPTYVANTTGRPYYYHGSISQSHHDIGNIHLVADIYCFNQRFSDNRAVQLSANPFAYFFQDAVSPARQFIRRVAIPYAYQYARPTVDGTTEWSTSTGTSHYALIDETVSNQGDYVFAETAGRVDTYTMSPLSQPPAGTNIEINYDIQAVYGNESVTFTLLDGSTVIKESAVSGTQAGSVVVTSAEWASVSAWPWTPTLKITSS
jgi:hypothetical protein